MFDAFTPRPPSRPRSRFRPPVARFGTIASRVEQLPLDAAAEVLVLLEPALAALEQQAARALERAPTGAQ